MTKIEYLKLQIEILESCVRQTNGNMAGHIYYTMNLQFRIELQAHLDALRKAEQDD